jgi:hypothetical protein
MNLEPAFTTARRARRIGALAPVAVIAVLALAACGAVSFPVTDPLGLDKAELELDLRRGPLMSYAPAAIRATGEVTVDFDDISFGNVPFNPSKLANTLNIAAATLDAGEDEAPETITFSSISVDVYLWQGAATYDAAATGDRLHSQVKQGLPLTIPLQRGECGVGSCEYHFGFGVPVAQLGLLSLTGADFDKAFAILAGEPDDNHVRLVVGLDVEPEEQLDGHVLTLRLDASEGSIGF